ncbi:MAG: ABC transporter permease [Verrucomicrobia bacterium]|nr:ABC transporter permease [Verrucomicrobiota bacterium]
MTPNVVAPPVSGPAGGILSGLRRLLTSESLVLWLALAYAATLAPFTPGFVSASNGQALLAYALPILTASLGLTLVLILGGMDLSVTAVISLASVVGGRIMSAEEGWMAGSPLAVPAGVAAMLLVGAGVGAVNGWVVTACRVPAFIATLATLMLFSGLALWMTQSRKIGGLPPGFVLLGQRLWMATAITAGVAALAQAALSRTLYGQWVRAIGYNPRAARISGVPVHRVTFATYVACGLFAAVSSILFTAALETGNPEMARDNLLDVVGAVVIGGTSLYGGRGRILGTVFGVLFLSLVDNSLNLLGLTFYNITMIKGGVILGAALMDALRNRLLAAA